MYPLVICYIAIETMAIEIVSFPIRNCAFFHSYITVCQRKPSANLMATAVKVMVEQSTFCDIVCKSPETQQMAKIFAEDGWVCSM